MLTKEIEEKYPFLSVITYGGNEYVGIINNQDNNITTMFMYDKLVTQEERTQLIELGEIWWWESNRMLPISIFLRAEMEEFKHIMMTMNTKDVVVKLGPCVNINNLAVKRVKRRSVQLVRKVK